jgi:large subunit ribosomal protein L10
MSKRVKTMVMSEITKRFGGTREFLVLDASKVTAVKVNQLRLRAAKLGIKMLNVKNTLAQKALAEVGVKALDPILNGPSALVWGSSDIVALAKEVTKWSKEKELSALKIKGGTLDGQTLDTKGVEILSKSAGRPELLGQILSLIKSPGGQLAAALLGPGGYLGGQVKGVIEKAEKAAESSGAAETAETAEAPAS